MKGKCGECGAHKTVPSGRMLVDMWMPMVSADIPDHILKTLGDEIDKLVNAAYDRGFDAGLREGL